MKIYSRYCTMFSINNNFNINNKYPTQKKNSFKARFFHSDSLKQVVEYAIEHNKFEELNEARKNISRYDVRKRLLVDIGVNKSGFPYIKFTRFQPKRYSSKVSDYSDYSLVGIKNYVSQTEKNPLKFALEKLIKLGNNAPDNTMYKKVVKVTVHRFEDNIS